MNQLPVEFFNVTLAKPLCIEGLSEDALREFADALQITVKDKDFGGFVTTTGDVQVTFSFGPDGNFQGVFALVNNQHIPLIPGVGSKELYVFKGAISGTNPGSGFKVEPELTVKYLNQALNNESNWEIFYASRVGVLNTGVSP